MKRTPTLFDVPKDSPSRKDRLRAFKATHGIWTHSAYRSSGIGISAKWIAVWVVGARKQLAGYGPEVDHMTGMDLVTSYCRLLGEGDLMTEGKTEFEAVELLAIKNELYPLP